MYPSKLKIVTLFCTLSCGFVLAGCGGGGDDAVGAAAEDTVTLEQKESGTPAVTQSFVGPEDATISGTMSKGELQGQEHEFEIVEPPRHGSVRIIDDYNGDFRYTPDPDYFGADSFTYRVVKTARRPLHGEVTLEITNVNDAPVLAALDDLTNSAETHDTTITLPATDIDTDALSVTVTSDDPAIAAVTGDDESRTIKIVPGVDGATRIRVSVSDGEFESERDFAFTVGEVTKQRAMTANMADGEAVFLTNVADVPVTLTLEHNGFPQFQSTQQMIDYVRDMPPVFVNEPFERKLWRFVRDNVYHNLPVTRDKEISNPWAIINSGGWGICSNVAAVYVGLAREAGFEARIWGLSGHVVPEIRIDGEWQMYDPDLAVYYYTPAGKIAAVSDLQADASLVSAPVNAIFAGTPYDFPYSLEVAGIYGSPADNYLGEKQFIPKTERQFQKLVMPPGAVLKYPGRWTPSVVGTDDEGSRLIDLYLQAKLTTPLEFTGDVAMPWMLWEIRGTGRVRIGTREFDVGSPELIEYVQEPEEQITGVEVVRADSPIEFIFFINALRYQLQPQNDVRITGREVWAIDMAVKLLKPESRVTVQNLKDYLKPRPVL